MNRSDLSPLSRREWLERVSGPALVASLGAGLLAAGCAATPTAPVAAAAAPVGPQPKPTSTPAANDLGARVYNVRDFGAKGDGTTLDTAAVQAAIDACHRDNGGIVLVPAGDFVIGTVELKSNLTLHLATRGRLLGSQRREDYQAGNGVPRGNGNLVLLYAVKAENLTIEGRGTIDGQGAAFYNGQGDGTAPGARDRARNPGMQPNTDRPHLMIFFQCENLRMQDVFLTASAYHCVRILQCRRINFDAVRIYNRVNKNNDGFHFNSCENVKVSNCEVLCQDDACALFGSTKSVTVTNCTFSTRWSVFRFGSGDVRDIVVSNCLIYDTYGCPIKISAGGARFENLSFSNIIMRNVTGPISVQFGGRSGRPGQTPAADAPKPYVRNIAFNGIRATVVPAPTQHPDIPFDPKTYDGEQNSCITLNAFGEAWLEDISLTDVHVVYAGGGSAELAAKRDIPQTAAEYFGVWEKAPLGPPAYGLFARNVRGLSLHNVRFEVQQSDLRPAVIFDHVQDATVVGLAAQGNPQAESLLRIIESREVLVSAARVLTPVPTFLRLEGAANEAVIVTGSDLRKAAQPLETAAGANADAVAFRS